MDNTHAAAVDFLFVHVPKRSNYYKPLDDFMYINYLPMGVLALCDLLNKNGIASRIKHLGLETILDENFSIARWVKENGIKVVGISLHWHFQAFDVIDVAQKIKRASPQTTIVLGGFTASGFRREILENFPAIDAIVSGDGEGSVVPFAHAVLQGQKDFSEVPNCTWRANGEVVENGITFTAQASDLEKLDYANLSLLDHYGEYRDFFRFPMYWMNNASIAQNLKQRLGPEKLFPLAIGRGCLHNCPSCGGNREVHKCLFERHALVYRPVEGVVDTMEKALSYGYTGFIISFDPTPRDDRYHLDMMAEMRRRGVRCAVNFDAWGLPTRAFLDAFRETFDLKTSYVAISAETGSEELRRKNKGASFTNQELFDTLAYMKAKNIPVVIYLGLGMAGETKAHVAETAAFAANIRREFGKILQGILCLPLQIEPHSAMFSDPDAHEISSQIGSFMDYYHLHGRSDNGPITYTGYAPKSHNTSPEGFDAMVLEQRCKHYCVINPRLFGRIPIPFLSKAICDRSHAAWKRRGFGKPAPERKTFQ
ncbi:MAG: B12-binding domain-containing radical SAM protein [Chloroflexota bacterium]